MTATGALALVFTVAAIAAQRLVELALSARHQRRLLARGAVEFGRRDFPLFVALHSLMPLALIAEVVWGGARPPEGWPWLLLPLAIAEALRVAAMRSLGEHWHVRVWVVPGEPPIQRGIYRWIAHPNYVAVVLELALLPALFGAWRTAIAASLFNAVLLSRRIPEETRALRWAATQPAAPAGPLSNDVGGRRNSYAAAKSR